jgi:hypothetical protein
MLWTSNFHKKYIDGLFGKSLIEFQAQLEKDNTSQLLSKLGFR